MGKTEVISTQVKDEEVKRADLNVSLSGSAVIAKVVAGSNISLASTGVDIGTGDVTIGVVAEPNFTKVGIGKTASAMLDVKSPAVSTQVLNLEAFGGSDLFTVDEDANGRAKIIFKLYQNYSIIDDPVSPYNSMLIRSNDATTKSFMMITPNGAPSGQQAGYGIFGTDVVSGSIVNYDYAQFIRKSDHYALEVKAAGTGTNYDLVLKAATGKIGFGLPDGVTPARAFDFRVSGDTNKVVAQFYNPDMVTDGRNLTFRLGKADASYQAFIMGYIHSTTVGNEAGFFSLYGDASGAGLNYKKGGRVGIGTLTEFGSGETVIGLKNATTVPSTNPTSALVMYSESGRFKVRESGGDISVLSGIMAIEFIIDGGGSALTTGIKGDLEIPFACTIQQVSMLADQSGSVVVDIWKDTYANFPPVDADSITASAPPTISSTTKSQDSTLTGWTTTVAAGDILRFNVDSITTIERVVVSLKVIKT